MRQFLFPHRNPIADTVKISKFALCEAAYRAETFFFRTVLPAGFVFADFAGAFFRATAVAFLAGFTFCRVVEAFFRAGLLPLRRRDASSAWAAARRATGIRYGEQLT